MSMTSNELDLIANANRYTMGKELVGRILKLLHKEPIKDQDKLLIKAINISHSVTKSQMRGAK